MPSLSTLTETTNNRGLTICGTAVAAIAVLYLLNAFVQSGYINALELVAGASWIGGCFLMSRWLNALGILVVSFTSSLVWGFWVDSQPVSDFLNFHNQAARVAEGGSLWPSLGSKSPPTVVYYAAFHALLGSDYATNYFAGAIAWTAGALLIYRAILPFVTSGQARMVCACTATYPSFVVFSVVPSSEGVVFLLVGASALLASKAARRSDGRRWAYAGLAGFAIGVLYLTRMNNAVLLLPCTLALLWCLPRPPDGGSAKTTWRESWKLRTGPPGVLLATFAAVIGLFGSLSTLETGEFRVGPSRFGELLLLFGTNTETNGGYNLDDAALAGYLSDDPVTKAAAPAKALDMAFDRVATDPWRFVTFAATTKVQRLWARERSLNHWSLGGRERENVNYYVRGSAILAADGAYRMVLLLFVVGLVAELRRPTTYVALGGIALLYSLPHIFIEVQPRYHLPMVPFLIVGAVLTFHRLLPIARKFGDRIYGPST